MRDIPLGSEALQVRFPINTPFGHVLKLGIPLFDLTPQN